MTGLVLCQRSDASCGACCGLYNRRDHGRASIRASLERRTRTLEGTDHTRGAFAAAAAALRALEPPPLFPSVRICPLLGFLDAARTRIGCLAHPAATGGVDLRDCGAYDAKTCEGFLCRSHASLSEEEAAFAATSTGDHHLYGLVVTDVPFLRAVLAAVASLSGAPTLRQDLERTPFRRALRDLLAIKEELAPGSDGLFGAFAARDGWAMPGGSGSDGTASEQGAPAHAAILACAGADPRSGNDLDWLESEIIRRLDACAVAHPRRRRPGTES